MGGAKVSCVGGKRTWLLVGGIVLAVTQLNAGEVSESLLQLPTAKITRSNSIDDANVERLRDGISGTIAHMEGSDSPAEIVFSFDEMVTANRFALTVPDGASSVRIELFSSTESPRAGFSLLRTEVLRGEKEAQSFKFPPTGSKWLMVRISPVEGANIAVADFEVFGYEGPPVTKYAFKESPAKAFDVLARLRMSESLVASISEDETKLFADARDGRLDDWTFAEAALLVSGVIDVAERTRYLTQIDQLETAAREATAGAETPFKKGEQLLAWMHSDGGPFANGYVADQTDVSVLLDTSTYNCVSSAVLYNILGRRLGLDLRAIEVPDHAFSVLYDGTNHADVETTTSQGFNPARDRAAQKSLNVKPVFATSPTVIGTLVER